MFLGARGLVRNAVIFVKEAERPVHPAVRPFLEGKACSSW